jgi:hypothetical protein
VLENKVLRRIFRPKMYEVIEKLRKLHNECHYRKQLIRKTVADWGLLQDAAQMKLDVLSAMHFITEAWRLIKPTTNKNCFVRCGFSSDHTSNNDDSALKLTEVEENDWRSLQLL